jgi:transposase
MLEEPGCLSVCCSQTRHGRNLAEDIVPVIPPKPLDYDPELYKLREKAERFFNNLKQFRRSVTRDEKLSQTFLAFIHLVAAWITIK